MGYELTMYVGETTAGEEKRCYHLPVAMVELRGVSRDSRLGRLAQDTCGRDVYIYKFKERYVHECEDDGDNWETTHDCYGKSLTDLYIDRVIDAIRQDIAAGDSNRRFNIALATLIAVRDEYTGGRPATAVLYGH